MLVVVMTKPDLIYLSEETGTVMWENGPSLSCRILLFFLEFSSCSVIAIATRVSLLLSLSLLVSFHWKKL